MQASYANRVMEGALKLVRGMDRVDRGFFFDKSRPGCPCNIEEPEREPDEDTILPQDERPATGDKVRILIENDEYLFDQDRKGTRGMVGVIIEDDNSDQPFRIKFKNGQADWYKESWVTLQERGDAQSPPSPEVTQRSPSRIPDDYFSPAAATYRYATGYSGMRRHSPAYACVYEDLAGKHEPEEGRVNEEQLRSAGDRPRCCMQPRCEGPGSLVLQRCWGPLIEEEDD